MAEPLKNYFNETFVSKLAEEVKSVYKAFDISGYKKAILNDDWEARELKDRMRHISTCLGDFLPEYTKAVQLLMEVAHKFGDFTSMVFSEYVEVYGMDHPELSLDAMELFTQHSSAEFAIRPFIIRYEKLAMERMLQWSKHENNHVRRLSSEGCRPRLPWAMALPEFKKDPAQVLPILENLKDDDSEYVRKSVANNINDITKDNPQVALELAKRWYGSSEKTNWIIKHGLRTLLKKGNEEALKIFGFKDEVNVEVSVIDLSENRIAIGGEAQFAFSITNKDKDQSFLKVGYVVGYMKSGGKTSEKIFHISEKEFAPKQTVAFKKKLSFRDLTTRKHYPGDHYIYISVNGLHFEKTHFQLTN
ncbi:MAG: DNA alkylation repair protein [Cyclobacteriaceae bacterium]